MDYLPRLCIDEAANAEPVPLSHYRDTKISYVLLGEPGSGKTRSFEVEADQQNGEFIAARKFARPKIKESWRHKTIFIDGLDEMRAGGIDGRIPLEDICDRLEQLGNPPFRISCREADWLGAIDQQELLNAARGREFKVLRLLPLSEIDIQLLVKQTLGADGEKFVEHAKTIGLYELLPNPQNLNILLEAVKDKKWPDTRKEAYELASRRLCVEQNEGHQLAVAGHVHPEETLLEAAGQLATCYLLGNLSGFALMPAKADKLYPAAAIFHDRQALPVIEALKSRLFKNDGDGRRAPDHRSTAEFLAARYLASLVKRKGDALPWYRLLSLVASSDGKPVSSLRGLWAWLASFLSDQQRLHLVDRDPVAVALYGDVRKWPTKDKIDLIKSLDRAAQRYPWIFGDAWVLSPIGALGTRDMTAEFEAILSSDDRSQAQQALVDCVLNALKYGETIPEIAGALEKIIRDTKRWIVIRKNALRVLTKTILQGNKDVGSLFKLLQDIHDGTLEDAEDELLGVLLEELYPKYIFPNEILTYLHKRKARDLIGNYYMFWTHRLLTRSLQDPDAIPTLLDRLAQKVDLLEEDDYDGALPDFAGSLLVEGVMQYGEAVPPARLYDWLGISLDKHRYHQVRGKSKGLAEWLTARPELCKSLLAEGIARAPNKENDIRTYFFFEWYQRLAGARLPSDIGMWILSQLDNVENRVAIPLFEEAIRYLWGEVGRDGLSFDFVASWVSQRPKFRASFEASLYCEVPEWRLAHAGKEIKWKEERANKRVQWLKFFRSHQQAFHAGNAPAVALYDLALAYFGLLVEANGETPYDRLRDFLRTEPDDGDDTLFQAALQGIRRSLGRVDLPSVKEVIDISVKGRQHLISRVCLAASEEISAANMGTLPNQYRPIFGQLVAMQLTLGSNENPAWYSAIKRSDPSLFAQVLVEYALASLKAKKTAISGLYGFNSDDDELEVAHIAVPQLLKGFPTRAPKEQHNYLERLLKGGLKHMTESDLLALIEQKLSLKGMEQGQRTLWLVCGLAIAPAQFQTRLEKHVGKNQERAAQVAGFFPNHGEKWPFHKQLSADALGWLIGLLGTRCEPYRRSGAGWVTPIMTMSHLVGSLISNLANSTDPEAGAALSGLLSRDDMAAWHAELASAVHGHATVERESKFEYPDVEKILHTLRNREPSSAADLAALTLDYLDDLAARIRNGANNEYRSYWNNPDDSLSAKRRTEDDCRNLILRGLHGSMQLHGARAGKEEVLVDNKRADIGVFYNDYFVPIEIKADDERHLWHALRGQLIEQYTRDPRAYGYGIFLALWFGGKGMPPPPNGSKKPQSPEELRDQLLTQVDLEDRHRISVRVIDCTLPKKKAQQ